VSVARVAAAELPAPLSTFNKLRRHCGRLALDDIFSGTEKYWSFNPSGGSYQGLASELQYRTAPGVTTPLPRDETYSWSQDANGNSYVGTDTTTLDKGTSYTRATETVQIQDGYGNVSTSSVYDYGNSNTPARSYSNTYLYKNNSNYSSRYIYNRLLSATLTSVTPNVVLAQNTYDGAAVSAPNGTPREWDAENYGTSFIYRGNVTQASSPGKTTNTGYDATGTVMEQDDNNGHAVNIVTSGATNNTLPDSLTPNGTASLQTQAAYNSPNYFPTSVAGPGPDAVQPDHQSQRHGGVHLLR
jgi:hypothetical protein